MSIKIIFINLAQEFERIQLNQMDFFCSKEKNKLTKY